MKTIFTLILIILSLSNIYADSIKERRAKILNIIDEEISEVNRLMRQSGENPDLMLRMAELNLEKARLWREEENQNYLSIPVEKRRKSKKSSFFKRSNKYFNTANNLCVKIVRRHKRYKKIGEVYYILGFNAKEANNTRKASKYLGLASRKTRNSKTKSRTQVTLAEVYYNQKKYSKAIPLYEKSLKSNTDKWWTKDSFNLAWSYYQTGKITKAISKMKEVYSRSSNKNYIDMRYDVERDIGVFFATSGRISEGIKFFENTGVNFPQKLAEIASKLMMAGSFSKALKVYDHALKYEKDPRNETQIYLDKLVLFEKSGRNAGHEAMASILMSKYRKNQVDQTQKKVLVYQLEKTAALLQTQVVGKTYRRLKKQRSSKAKQAIKYFGYLSELDKKRTDEFLYLKAETAYAANFKSKSFQYYKETFEFSKKENLPKFRKRSMDGLLAALSLKGNQSTKNNIYTFENYLSYWPKGKRSKDIYKRLFNNYLDAKDYASAKKTLLRYKKDNSKDYKTQEAMIAKLMDIDRKRKDNTSIRNWISDIDTGVFVVSGKFKNKLKELLTTIQIEEVQKQLKGGEKKKALVGYHEIVADKYSTKKSKINAKYNLAVLYYELNDPVNAYKWSIEAIKEMSANETIKFSASFITIANFLFNTLEFKKSANLSENIIYKTCSKRFKQKNISYKNAVFIYLADSDFGSVERIIAKSKKCKIPRSYLNLATYELMREYKAQEKIKKYEGLVNYLEKIRDYKFKMIDEYLFLGETYRKLASSSLEKKYMKKAWSLYYTAKKSKAKVSISMSSLDYFAERLIYKMKKISTQISDLKYRFPEKTFANIQKKKLKLLEKLTTQASDVQAIGSGAGIVSSFKILYDSYNGVAAKLMAFSPQGKSPEYVKAFKNDMNSLANQLRNAGKNYYNEAKRAIENNTILSENNFAFQPNDFSIRYMGLDSSYIMDRGGNR